MQVINDQNLRNMAVSLLAGLSIGFAYLFIALLGSFTNGLVILAYLKWSTLLMKQPKDILIISLALGDFVMCAVICPLGFVSAFSLKWVWGFSGCMFYGFFSTWVGLANIAQLTCLALERYLTISNSTPHAVSMKNSFKMIMASWFVRFIASGFPLVGWSRYTYEGFGLHCSIVWDSGAPLNSSYAFLLLFFFFFVPIAVIAFSYGKIFIIVRRMYHNADSRWGSDAQGTLDTFNAQVKASKQLLLMIAGYLFAWTPYAVMSTLVTFTDIQYTLEFLEYPSLLAKFASVYNPLLYFFSYESLRTKAKDILRCRSDNLVHPYTFNISGNHSRGIAPCSNI